MAEVTGKSPRSLSEQYLLPNEEKPDAGLKTVEVTKAENPVSATTEEVAQDKIEETHVAVNEQPSTAASENSEAPAGGNEKGDEESATAAEENRETLEQNEGASEEPEIKLETAPADFRFPTTNQTRHCFTRYIEYHRCVDAKGEDAQECNKFAKFYRSLCPCEWIERWNEQRETGTFPGPL